MRVKAKPFSVEIKNSRKTRQPRLGLFSAEQLGQAEAPKAKSSWAAEMLGSLEKEASGPSPRTFEGPPKREAPIEAPAQPEPSRRILLDLSAAPPPPPPEEDEIVSVAAEDMANPGAHFRRVIQLDKDRRKIVLRAKREAIKAARKAVATLNELGFAYSLVEVPRAEGSRQRS